MRLFLRLATLPRRGLAGEAMRALALPCLAAALLLPRLEAADALRGVPADVDAGMSVSYDTAAKSRLHPALRALQDRMDRVAEQGDPDAHRRNKALAERLGLTRDSSHHLDLGFRVRPGADGEPSVAFFAAARIDMRKSAFDAFAREQGVSPVVGGDLSGWDIGSLFPALYRAVSGNDLGATPEGMLDGHAVAMPADNVILVAPVRELGRAHQAWLGKAPSYAYPARVSREADAVPLRHTTVFAPVGKMIPAEPDAKSGDPAGGLQEVAIHLGESPSDILLVASATYRTEAQAKLAAEQLRALLPIAALGLQPSEEDDESAKFLKAEAAAFLSTLKVERSDVALRLTASHPLARSEKLVGRMETLLQEITGAQAAPPARPATKLEPAQPRKTEEKPR